MPVVMMTFACWNMLLMSWHCAEDALELSRKSGRLCWCHVYPCVIGYKWERLWSLLVSFGLNIINCSFVVIVWFRCGEKWVSLAWKKSASQWRLCETCAFFPMPLMVLTVYIWTVFTEFLLMAQQLWIGHESVMLLKTTGLNWTTN